MNKHLRWAPAAGLALALLGALPSARGEQPGAKGGAVPPPPPSGEERTAPRPPPPPRLTGVLQMADGTKNAALIEDQNQGEGPFFKELELIAKPTVSVGIVPTDTLASGDTSGDRCFSYMLALETADGWVNRFWVSDDLELLSALQKAIDPLLIEDNVNSKPGEHYVRSIIYGRDVVAKRLFDLPERALDGEDVGMEVAISRILSGMEGTDE